MPPLPWGGGSDREGSLLGSCFSTAQKDVALLILFANKNTFLQMKTQKTGHPSVPRRMAEVIQGPPTGCFALSDFVFMYFLPFTVVAALPSVHWCKRKTMSCFPWQTYKSRRRAAEEQGRSLSVFILCGVCLTLECRKMNLLINKQIREEITYSIILVGDKPTAIYQMSTRNKCLLSFSHF